MRVLLKDFLDTEDIDFQLVPPAVHRRNAAKQSIRTFQNRFVAGLCGVDKDIPLHLWVLDQAELSLNLLRGSHINPKLSAWAQVNRTYDYNRVPLAPPGCRVLVHTKPQHCTTWSPHALDGWYVGPAVDSYRCYCVWMWDTCAIRICDTVSWFPTKVTLPSNSSTDLITNSQEDMIANALLHRTTQSPVAPLTTTHKAALHQLLEILLPTTLSPIPNPTLCSPASSMRLPSPPAAPNLHVIPELAAPSLRVRNPTPNPNPLRQGNGNPNPNPNPTSNPPGSVPMRTPLPPHPYRDALLLPSSPSLPATYDTTTAPKRRQHHGTIPHNTVIPTPLFFLPTLLLLIHP